MITSITNLTRRPGARVRALVPGRKVHLIDIENLCGSGRPSRTQVAVARVRYEESVKVNEGDLVIVASAFGNLMSVALGWPGVRYLGRNGKDGADICLASVIVEERVSERFDSVVMASGDGGLAPFVAHLAGRGLDTTVVSYRKPLSRQMRMAAHTCIVLNPELEDIA